ncbi:MAG: hypothetical protein CM15mP77_2560 [Synechococcus sp.]|nr:MAG: hypothetical protein CM15mP77_2560 [Synechococcus sp.]
MEGSPQGSGTPVAALRFGKAIAEAGADLFFVQGPGGFDQSHRPRGTGDTDLEALCRDMGVPVIIGNCVTYDVALQLMRAGAAGVMVGIGPGAACTSRGVLGVGIPQATAVSDCAAARADYEKETGRYVPIVADGDRDRGDICSALPAELSRDDRLADRSSRRSARSRFPLGMATQVRCCHAEHASTWAIPEASNGFSEVQRNSMMEPITCWVVSRPPWAPSAHAPSGTCRTWRLSWPLHC